jgi:hypothetical protein
MIISLSSSTACLWDRFLPQGVALPLQLNGPGAKTFMSARTGTGGQMRAASQPEDAAVIACGGRTEEPNSNLV